MKAYVPHCKYCGTELIHGEVCGECLKQMDKCPIHKPICSLTCLYKKEAWCDFPFIGRIRAYPSYMEIQ